RYRVLVIALLVAGALVLGVGQLHAYQMHRHADLLLERKEEALRADETRRAARLLEQYLHFVEDDSEARAELAILSAETAGSREEQMRSVHRLERILREDESRNDVRQTLATLLMAMQQWTDAAVHFETLCKETPDDPELLRNHALCLLSSGKFEQAAQSLRETIERVPDDIRTYERLAFVLRRELGRPADAARILEQLITNNPTSAEAFLARTRHQLFFGEVAGARIDLKSAGRLAPDDLEVNLLTARVVILDPTSPQPELEGIAAQLEDLIDSHPDDARLYRLLSRVARRLGQSDRAVACLERGLEALPDHSQLQTDLILLRIDRRQTDEARELLESLGEDGQSPLHRYMRGRAAFADGHWRQARDEFQELAAAGTLHDELASEVDLWLARSCEKLQQLDEATTAYQRILEREPAHNAARRGLLNLLEAQGALGKAISNLEHAGQLAPAGAVIAARMKFERERTRPAASRDWSEVEHAIRYAEKLAPRSSDVALLQAALFEQKDDLARARRTLSEARRHTADDLRLWLEEIRLARMAGDPAAADTLWTQAQERFAGQPGLLAARIRQAVSLPGASAIEQLDALEAELADHSEPVAANVVPDLVKAWTQMNEPGRALSAWESLAATDELQWHVQRFDLAVSAGAEDIREDALQAIREIGGPDNRFYRCLRARHLIDRARDGDPSGLHEARQLVHDLRSDAPNWSQVWITQANLQEFDEHRSAAIDSYAQAFALDAENEPLVRKLLGLLCDEQRLIEAGQAIETYERHTGRVLPPDLSILAAQIAFQAGHTERALDYAQRTAFLHPHHAPSQLWLGRLLSRTSDARAAAVLQRAIELDPTNGDAWVALVEHRIRSEEPDRVSHDLREAEKRLSAEDIPLTFARCYELLGQNERAAAAYQTALSLHAGNADVVLTVADYYRRAGDTDRARELLWMVLEPECNATPQQKSEARRSLAE
ncbi:MAG: tetratricopeptide repeat protein, partial [Maioricimonas sp. JB045]